MPIRQAILLLTTILLIAACKSAPAYVSTTKDQDTGTRKSTSNASPTCVGDTIKICEFPGQFPLAITIELLLKNIQDADLNASPALDSLTHAQVACAESAYPGSEATIIADSKQRGTFICLFNNRFVMNMALNRIRTFTEDFRTVDAEAGYQDQTWAKEQAKDSTLSHNLESPDITRYLTETKKFIDLRGKSRDLGTRLEQEFLNTFIIQKIDAHTGKPKTVILGLPLPRKGGAISPSAELSAVVSHEIFHSIFFHSTKMQELVKKYIDSLGPIVVQSMYKKLAHKGYDVINEDLSPLSEKQIYTFYNETQAYLLGSAACTDGAFTSFVNEDQKSAKEQIPKTAPFVVRYSNPLRKILVSSGVLTAAWVQEWSPDLTQAFGCHE